MRFLMVLLIALLSSCSSEQAPNQNTTQVTVNFGASLASGALLPSGQVPINVASITVQSFSAPNNPTSSPIAMQAPNFSTTLIIPNGNNIYIIAKAKDAAGNVIYQGESTPHNLIGTPISISIKLNLSIHIQSNTQAVTKNQTINLQATVAGNAPTPTSPLLWQATGGSITVNPGSNGGSAIWTAPANVGTYNIRARIDPSINPDQDAQVFAEVTLSVINRAPTAASATITTNEDTVSIAVTPAVADPDIGDAHTFTIVSQGNKGIANVAGSQLIYTPNTNANGNDTFVFKATDAGGLSINGTATVTIIPVNDIPIISLLGSPTVDIYTGINYIDAGATASDIEDGNITASIVTFNPVNTTTPATYTVTYNVVDSYGAAAQQVSRTVNVIVNAPAGTTHIWTGALDTNWNLAANWDVGTVPNNTSNVYIPAAPANQPSAGNAVLNAGKITVEAGATLTKTGDSLNISTDFINNGTVHFLIGGLAGSIDSTNGTTGTFFNNGTITTVGSLSGSAISMNVVNTGSILVRSLLLLSSGTGTVDTSNGTIDIATGTTLTVGGLLNPTTITVGAITTFVGSGTLEINNSALVLNRNLSNPTGSGISLLLTGTSFINGTGTLTNTKPLDLTSDTINVNLINNTTGTLTLSGTTLNNSVTNSGAVTLTNFAAINGLFTSPVGASTINGNGSPLTLAGGVNVDGMVMDNVLLTLTTAPALFDNVTFQNYAATATPLLISYNATAQTFNNLNYNSPLTTGFHIGGTGTGNNITVASTNITGTTDPTFIALGNVVTWPVVAGPATVISAANLNNTPCGVTWALGGSPYLVASNVSIASGCRLQIDPGVVVKFNSGLALTANLGGILDIYGQPGVPVIFTSAKDDTIGGDTNGDAAATVPVPGNWSAINFNQGSGTVSFAEVRYSFEGINMQGASPALNDITILESFYSGLTLGAFGGQTTSPTVTNLTIIDQGINDPFGISMLSTVGTGVLSPIFTNVSINNGNSWSPSIEIRNLGGGGFLTPTFNGVNIITTIGITNESILVSGAGSNPALNAFTITGGIHGLSLIAGATGSYSNINITGNGVMTSAVAFEGGSAPSLFTNITLDNADVPYSIKGQSLPAITTNYAGGGILFGAGIVDTYSVPTSGVFSQVNTILPADPLAVGSSAYRLTGTISISTGSRLQVDPYTVMKFNSGTSMIVQGGATLDIYGAPNAAVVMTTVNDDTVAPVLATSTGIPAIGSWSGIQYQASSLGSISDAQVHYANNALEIASASPTITNFTATEFAGIGLYLRTFAANHTANPVVSNIVLTTSDTLNQPIFMLASATDTTQTIAPIINGTSITTASTSTALGAIHLSGVGVNPTISNMTINGGGYNLYATNNASGVFTNNTFNGATSEAVYLSNNANGIISINSTNTITNAPAPYSMNQAFPSVDVYASIGVGVVDTYTVHLNGNFNAANSILVADPLNTGASAYLVSGSIAVNNGARLQIDPYTVMKFNSGTSLIVQLGGTLDVYGAPNAPVIMTTVNDDTVAPILPTSTGIPAIGSWSGIQYQASSLGTMSDTQAHYANNALDIAAASPTITNFTATEFGGIGLYLHTFAANQTASPSVTNIVLTTSDTLNQPISMSASATDPTQTIAPVINGTSITTASTSTSLGAIHLSGIGVNPTISNMTINGGGYNLYATNNASGVFTNNTFNGATTAAIYLTNGVLSIIDASNTVQNTPAAYVLVDQLLPTTIEPLLGFNGVGVADPYSLRITGTLPASVIDYTMNPNPLGIGNSVYQITGTLRVASGARLVINPGTVVKSIANSLIVNSGGTLDIYGSALNPVTFTSIKDDTVGGDTNLDGALTLPASREGLSLNFSAGSLGSMSFFNVRYSDGFNISSSIPMNDVSRFKGGFGMKFAGIMNQTVSNLRIDHGGIGGDTALYVSGAGTNPIFTGVNTVDKYSATHEAVIIKTGANPVFQNFTIDLHGNQQPALAIYDAATTVTVQNNVIQNAGRAVVIANGASPIIDNNIIRNSNTGVYLALWFNPVAGQAGNPTITNNRIVGNNTGIYVHNTASATIAHNLIRTNANIGVVVDALQTAQGLALNNNLIVENNVGVQMLDDLGTQTGANALLQSNTIASNLVFGLTIDTYAAATINDNIIANNTADFAVLPIGLAGDYNLTTFGVFPSVGPNITGIVPQFANAWYLSDGSALFGNTAVVSPAINASINRSAAGVGYLTLNPYAQTSVTDAGQLDIGYHHATADVTALINPATSTVITDILKPALNGNVIITITPNVLQSGLQIAATITSLGNTVGSVNLPAKDLGDGTYQVIFTASGLPGGLDTVNILVNGVLLGATGVITW